MQKYKIEIQLFSRNLAEGHIPNGIFNRGVNINCLAGMEGGDPMDLTSFPPETVVHKFDTICKRALRGERVDYYRAFNYRIKHETLFCELDERQVNAFETIDRYPSDKTYFQVQDYEIGIENELLAAALLTLPKIHRDIVLLSFFMEVSDVEIARTLNIVRSTVQYQRTSSLEKLKKYMKRSK